ncbi:MAG: hypothetical protein JSS39_17565 [Nitrospira sp.]|nr:hypothetical protein [Nitrospira sp.]
MISRKETGKLRRQYDSQAECDLSVSDDLDVLKSVTASVQAAGIPYMVTGSIAANFYAPLTCHAT